MKRKAAVAGSWYPGSSRELKKEIEGYIDSGATKIKALGVVAPHAGYMFSGHTAGRVFSSVQIPDELVVLAPNHTGLGEPAAINLSGSWEMPFGDVNIASDLAERIFKAGEGLFVEDHLAHLKEHSLEIELPFISYFNPQAKIVPICLGRRTFEFAEQVGQALARALADYDKPVLIVASSDMNHQEDVETTKRKDDMAIEKMLAFDPPGLVDTVRSNRITMCGVIPTAAMLVATKQLGARQVELVDYTHSGMFGGGMSQVVGYAGIRVS
jgi:MEMO1 family protein